MNKKLILIPLVILAALGLVFLARNRFSADAPKKNGKGEVSENGTQNGGSNGTPAEETTSTGPLLRYQAPPGLVRLYEVSMITTINLVLDMNLQPGQPPQTQTETLRLVGNLECSGYQSPREDLLLLGCTFKEVSIETDQIPLDATMRKFVAEQLRDEFFFTMTPSGKFKEFYQAPTVQFQFQGLQKALLIHTRIILPERGVPSWEVTEEDQTGTFFALYTGHQKDEKLEEIYISKEKAYYESVSTRSLVGGTDDGSEVMAYPQGKTTATFMISEGYNSLVEQNETIEIVGEGFGTGTQVKTKTVFRFLNSRIDKKRKEKSGADMERTLGGLQKSGMRGGAAEEEYLENQKIARLEKEAEGHSVDEILATLRHLIESGRANSEEAYNAVMILSALLALDDTRLEKIQDLLQNDSNIALLEMITSALGNAGTPGAQTVLVETIADGKIDLQVRTSALISFAPPMTPSPEAEEAMKGMVDPADKDNLGTNSLFILGVMANRLGTTDPGRAAELVHHILDQEQAFKEADQTHFFLGALENTGHPAAYEKIIPYLDNSETQVRVDAVSALGRMPQPEATTHLVQAMGDESPEVRVAAILAASNRSSGSELKAGVKNALLSDPSKEVRQEALSYFAGALETDPSVAPLLQQVATSDPDPEIQQAAREVLNP